MKSFWRFAMVAATAAMFAACDSDSGTSASDSNAASQESSSSSVKESSSSHSELVSESTSSSSAEKVDPESPQGDESSCSSSGVILSSSSAEKVDPESTQGDNSSSSIDAKGDVSSSSTSLVVYSSGADVIIEIGSSSSGSTSESDSCVHGNITYKNGFHHTINNLYYVCNDGEWVRYIESTVSPDPDLTYDTLVDPRDNQRYLTLEITGWDSNATAVTLTYMAQNLNYGTMTLGANEQDDDNTVEKYCYSDTAWYCEQFGGLYQWAEMMNLPYECNTQSCADQIDPDGDGFHQGICPDGWHLMNYYEASAVSNEYSYAGMKAMVLWSNAQGTNNSGFSAVGAGYRDRDGEFVELFEYVYFYYPIEHSGSPEVASYLLKLYSTGATMHQAAYKTFGSSVRCVKDY